MGATVWAVACLSNGDIAAGSSDGLVRVFTRADARVADLETLQVSFLWLNSPPTPPDFATLQNYDTEVSKTALNPCVRFSLA